MPGRRMWDERAELAGVGRGAGRARHAECGREVGPAPAWSWGTRALARVIGPELTVAALLVTPAVWACWSSTAAPVALETPVYSSAAIPMSALALVLATPERPDDAANTLRAAFGNEATERDIADFAERFRVPGGGQLRLERIRRRRDA